MVMTFTRPVYITVGVQAVQISRFCLDVHAYIFGSSRCYIVLSQALKGPGIYARVAMGMMVTVQSGALLHALTISPKRRVPVRIGLH
jgi:hypothetical protein